MTCSKCNCCNCKCECHGVEKHTTPSTSKRTPSPAQLENQKRFAANVRAGTYQKKPAKAKEAKQSE